MTAERNVRRSTMDYMADVFLNVLGADMAPSAAIVLAALVFITLSFDNER